MTEEIEIFLCINHIDTLCKPNFMFLGRTVIEKNAIITCKNSKLHNCPNKKLEVIIPFFSKTVRLRNMKFGLDRESI